MKKTIVVAITAMMCLSLPAMAGIDKYLGLEGTADGTLWLKDVQTSEGWKVKDTSLTGEFVTDRGVTMGSTSMKLVDTDGAWAQQALGIGLWRFWNELKTVGTKVTMDVTLYNNNNELIPDQWFEMDVAFNGQLTGWGTTAIAKQAVAVPWNEQTFSLTFVIPEALSIQAQNATQNWGDMFIRTYHGSQGATYWIDNVRVVPEPATMVLLGLGSLIGLKRRK